ncbi:MAG: exodeoxyribonuclease VII large subunit [bacterium]|nr:exodeoxyribonuclease VII large subunit [bacterium]
MRVLTVSEFLGGINEVLASVPALVEGEVSGYSMSQGKWAFFSLKDERGMVACFMPAWKVRHEVEDGMLVRVAGVPRVYEKSGKFSITVEALEPVGEGSLKRAFELLCEKLRAEGLFDAGRKRTLPRFPERIGLVASGDSAAYSDFLRILQNRWGGARVVHCDVAVQGTSAVDAICAALHEMREVDVVVLTRGGGSLEDLMAFNSEEVARAVFACAVPVVVGVGHERDVTIADLVADVRASTPSNAAERAVPERAAVASELRLLEQGMASAVRRAVDARRAMLDRFLRRGVAFVHARRMLVDAHARTLAQGTAVVVQQAHQRTRDAEHRVMALFTARRDTWQARVDAAARLLVGLNPARLLERGYAITTSGGRIVRDAAQLRAGDMLHTRFARGSATSTVTQTSGE